MYQSMYLEITQSYTEHDIYPYNHILAESNAGVDQ